MIIKSVTYTSGCVRLEAIGSRKVEYLLNPTSIMHRSAAQWNQRIEARRIGGNTTDNMVERVTKG